MLADAVANEIARHGAPHTLRRETVVGGGNDWTRTAGLTTYIECIARIRKFRPDEIKGGIVEGDCLAVISAPTLAGTPAAGDRIAVGTHTADAGAEWYQVVHAVETRVGHRVATWRLIVRR